MIDIRQTNIPKCNLLTFAWHIQFDVHPKLGCHLSDTIFGAVFENIFICYPAPAPNKATRDELPDFCDLANWVGGICIGFGASLCCKQFNCMYTLISEIGPLACCWRVDAVCGQVITVNFVMFILLESLQ